MNTTKNSSQKFENRGNSRRGFKGMCCHLHTKDTFIVVCVHTYITELAYGCVNLTFEPHLSVSENYLRNWTGKFSVCKNFWCLHPSLTAGPMFTVIRLFTICFSIAIDFGKAQCQALFSESSLKVKFEGQALPLQPFYLQQNNIVCSEWAKALFTPKMRVIGGFLRKNLQSSAPAITSVYEQLEN